MVLDFEIRLEVLGTRALVVQRDDADDAAPVGGAGALQVGGDVGRAADVPVVARDALADVHASVARAVDHQHLVVADARCVERLPLTVLAPLYIHTPSHTVPSHTTKLPASVTSAVSTRSILSVSQPEPAGVTYAYIVVRVWQTCIQLLRTICLEQVTAIHPICQQFQLIQISSKTICLFVIKIHCPAAT